MYFDDTTPPAQRSYRDLKTLLSRTSVPAWDGFGFSSSAASLRTALCFLPEEMQGAAKGFLALALRLGESFSGAALGDGEALVPAVPWLRQAALALAPFPALSATAGGSGDDLRQFIEQALLCQTLAAHAGRAKDGAMDTRVLFGGFAWHLLSLALTALRKEVARLSDAGKEAEGEALLRPFAPLLVLMARDQAERAADKDDRRVTEEQLAAEVQAAAEDRDDAEAALRLRGAPQVERAVVAKLARKGEPPQATPGKRRSRR